MDVRYRVTVPSFLHYLSTRPSGWGIIDFRESSNKPISGTYYQKRVDGRYNVFYIIYRVYPSEVIYRTITYIISLETVINEYNDCPNQLALAVARLDLYSAMKILAGNRVPVCSIYQFIHHRFSIVCRLTPSYYTVVAQYIYFLVSEMVVENRPAPQTMIVRKYSPFDITVLRPIYEKRKELLEKLIRVYYFSR